MRPLWRWIVNGKPKPPPEPITLFGDWVALDPRTDALKAMVVALDAQTAILGTQALLLERFAVAAESVVAALDRAEQRALAASEQGKLERA